MSLFNKTKTSRVYVYVCVCVCIYIYTNCCYNIGSTQFPRISLYALTLRFVLIEITKVVKPVHKKEVTQYFWQYSVCTYIYIYIYE